MTLWVLDTDRVSLFQQNHPIVSSRIRSVNPEEVAVTVITAEEQFYGRMNQIRRANSADSILSAYARLRATLDYFKTVNLLSFDQEAYNCYNELVRQKIRIGTQDLRIAACVISRHGVLVTRNRRDFERIPGLRFEDWTIQ
ncbi:MAG TPA: type II toxin-antitoxin system VapC family toxin [Kamptonema sp.]|nr:type II toxin-antitoxin system VapC family toxin [Kamptonema sp.]